MRGVALGLAVAVLVTAVAGQAEEVKPERPKASVSPAPENFSLSPEVNDRKRFFLGKYSTTTYTDVVMVTSTVFFSCLSGTGTAVCQGRRRRRGKKDLRTIMEIEDEANNSGLESSLGDLAREAREAPDLKDLEAAGEVAGEEGSKFLGFNVWTTTRTTTTVTMLFTDTSVTIRLSYYCLAGQLQLPAFNCVR